MAMSSVPIPVKVGEPYIGASGSSGVRGGLRHMTARLSSLRLRLVLLVLAALIPAAVVIYYSAADRRADSGDRVRVQTLQLATNAAADYNRAVASTREFLLPIGQLLGLLQN